VITCGALGGHVREIARRRGWHLELHCLPALLHNRPASITPLAERLVRSAQARGLPVALGYADCGTYGALDELCRRLGLRRLPGLHCYDLLAGPRRVAALFDAEPGTYVLTDFLVRSFRQSVLAELGLDRHPELWPDYFGHYRRVVWLAQSRDPSLEAEAQAVAGMFGLPLTVTDTGTAMLERELEQLLAAVTPPERSSPTPAQPQPAAPGSAQSAPGSCAETAAAPFPGRADPSSCTQTAAIASVSDHESGTATRLVDHETSLRAETAVIAAETDHSLGVPSRKAPSPGMPGAGVAGPGVLEAGVAAAGAAEGAGRCAAGC
jgi:hypothetical protein